MATKKRPASDANDDEVEEFFAIIQRCQPCFPAAKKQKLKLEEEKKDKVVKTDEVEEFYRIIRRTSEAARILRSVTKAQKVGEEKVERRWRPVFEKEDFVGAVEEERRRPEVFDLNALPGEEDGVSTSRS